MKSLVLKISVVLATISLFAAPNLFGKDNKVDLTTNITCGGCVNSIKGAFKGVEGVKDISANVETKVVTVSFDDAKISSDKIKSTITDLGYTASENGKSCDSKEAKSCDSKVEKTASKKECGSEDNCCSGKEKKTK